MNNEECTITCIDGISVSAPFEFCVKWFTLSHNGCIEEGKKNIRSSYPSRRIQTEIAVWKKKYSNEIANILVDL